MEDKVARLRHVLAGGGKADAEACGDRAPARIAIDQRHRGARYTGAEISGENPDHARADDRDPIADPVLRSPGRVERSLHLRRQGGAFARDIGRNRTDAFDRNREPSLMRMEREYALPDPLGGSGLDDADCRIAVLHRKWKFPRLERAAHAPPLALRHPAVKNERFRPAADRADQRPDSHLAGAGRRRDLLPELGPSGFDDPKRSGFFAINLPQ